MGRIPGTEKGKEWQDWWERSGHIFKAARNLSPVEGAFEDGNRKVV